MYDVDDIKKNYRKFTDSKIRRLAKYECRGLRKEVVPILIEELQNRNLGQELVDWVKAETDELSELEKEHLFNRIYNSTCPKCSGNDYALQGYEINRIVSFLISTSIYNKEKILCTKCGKAEKTASIFITLFLGWWSGRGLFFTPFRLMGDLINLLFAKKISKRIISRFLDENTGNIRLLGAGEDVLVDLIIAFNENENDEEKE